MVQPIVLVSLVAGTVLSFWASIVEATYLTLRPFSLKSSAEAGSSDAAAALAIVGEKTKLVSVTTFIDTIANVVLATSMGLVLSEFFGPVGWIYNAIIGSFAIMTLLYLLPKAIGIEHSPRMAMLLAPATRVMLDALSPMAVPLTSVAKALSQKIVGKPSYNDADLVDEFEDVVAMLEKAGHIEPDAGRLLRTALASSRSTAADILTDTEQIIHVSDGAQVYDALRAMGRTNHPRLPVYNDGKKEYVGAVTFRSISKALDHGRLDDGVLKHMIQPARVDKDDSLASVIEKMQDAGATIAFVYEGGKMVGIVTLSDIIEEVMGIRV